MYGVPPEVALPASMPIPESMQAVNVAHHVTIPSDANPAIDNDDADEWDLFDEAFEEKDEPEEIVADEESDSSGYSSTSDSCIRGSDED